MLVEFEKKILSGGIFLNWGAMGANVLVEFENVFLIGGIFLQLGAFFTIWGIFLSWGQKVILGSRKSAILGIIWTPEFPRFL